MNTDPLRTNPDFSQFLKVLRREGRPDHLPFYEHITTRQFMIDRLGISTQELTNAGPDYWRLYVEFWIGMGYDCVPVESPMRFPLRKRERTSARSHGSEASALIHSWAEFESYAWPDLSSPIDFTPFEQITKHLPDGAKMVAGCGGGPFEWTSRIMGLEGLSTALCEAPDLFEAVLAKIRERHLSGLRQLASMDAVGALRQGDDLGFKTSTFLAPTYLREYYLPIYKEMTDASHAQGKPFILHSCGNLEAVYDDLIDVCGIDAKHSFEDVVMPVAKFKEKYGQRVTPLGGLDVDFVCRASEEELRAYTRRNIDQCFHDGYWALGTGNSLTDYMPVRNYMIVLEEAIRYTGR